MNSKTIIFITGLSGSGKSTIARELERTTGYALFIVGQFQREWAIAHGFSDAAEFNRKAGLEKAYFSILPDIIERISQLVKANAGVIVESLYTKSLLDKVVSAFPRASVHILNLTTSRHIRAKRYATRAKTSPFPWRRNPCGSSIGKNEESDFRKYNN